MRPDLTYLWMTAWLGIALAAGAAAQIECTVVGAGGDSTGDGSIFVLGQFATGVVTGSDDLDQGVVPCWVEGGVPCAGDVDGDLDVDLSDLSILLSAFGSCAGDPAYEPDADFNGDDCVALADLSILLAAFGTTCN